METATPIAAIIEPAATLEYASRSTIATMPAARLQKDLLWLAVLSGLCVGSCFLVLWKMDSDAPKALHLVIFGVTLAFGVKAGVKADAWSGHFGNRPIRRTLDMLATVGLTVIGLAPLALIGRQEPANWMAGILGAAYLALACSTPRHLLLYRGLARMARDADRRGLGRSLSVLGVFKLIYEAIWLLCCAVPLLLVGGQAAGIGLVDSSAIEQVAVPLAFGALFGAMGFAAIWIAMIVIHARCVNVSREVRGSTAVSL